ncbi:MAG: hypothetical protein LVQ64_05810, partial [Thermoplasmatales archaeon]|nr:hypothetical protein [Thermoplasmatales archaeon]
MWAGLLAVTPATSWAALIAAGMVALNLYVLWRLLLGPKRPSISTAVLGIGILLSQLIFWMGTAYYIEVPTVGGFTVFGLAAQFMMVPFGLWLLSLVFEQSEHPIAAGGAWTWTLALLVVGNEVFMSWAFAALVPGMLPTAIDSFAAVGHALLVSLSSVWYYWPMGVTMAVLIRGCRFDDATTFVAPWAIDVPIVGAIAMAAIMSGGIYILWRGTQFTRVSRSSLVLRGQVGAAFLAMGLSWVGSFLFLPGAGFAPFAGVMVIAMSLETVYLIARLARFGYGRASTSAAGEPASSPMAAPSPAAPRPKGRPDGSAMTSNGGPVARSVFTFRATRQVLARRWAIPLFLLIAAVFAFAAMIMGGMLVFARTGYTHLTVIVLTTASGGPAWWNYPGVIVGFPNGGLFLPFFGTLTMLIVSIGVGAGMSVAVVLWTRLIRLRRLAASGNVAIGSMAGLTPAFLSLATIGACCTITTSTAAGLGVVAQTSGTTAYTLLANNWFLGVFEIVVLTIALLAHEALLETYGPLLGLTTSPNGRIVRLPDDLPTPAPLSGATVVRAVVRVVLLLGGVLWALAGVGLAATYNYPFSSASFWFAVLVQHEFIAAVA